MALLVVIIVLKTPSLDTISPVVLANPIGDGISSFCIINSKVLFLDLSAYFTSLSPKINFSSLSAYKSSISSIETFLYCSPFSQDIFWGLKLKSLFGLLTASVSCINTSASSIPYMLG